MSKDHSAIKKHFYQTLRAFIEDTYISKQPDNLQKAFRLKLHQKLYPLLDKEGALKTFIDNYIESYAELKWLKKQLNYFKHHIDKVELLNNIAEVFALELLKDPLWLITDETPVPNIKLTVEKSAIQASFKDFFSTYLTAEDQRQQIDDRPIRRLDSLSRIFALTPSVSVCSAVAFHQGQLLISANVSNQDSQQQIRQIFVKRTQLLQDLILEIRQKVQSETVDQAFLEYLDQRSTDYANKMMEAGLVSLPLSRLQQDISKFVHAMTLDQHTFSQTIKDIWLTKPLTTTIMLPAEEKIAGIKHVKLTIKDSVESNLNSLTMPNSYAPANLSNFHAEQMLGHYVFRIKSDSTYNSSNPLQIGISKLCCHTCHRVLQMYPVKVRGTHGQAYEQVEPLLNPTITPPNSPQGNLLKGPVNPSDSITKSHHKPKPEPRSNWPTPKPLNFDDEDIPSSHPIDSPLLEPAPVEPHKQHLELYVGDLNSAKLGGLFETYLLKRATDYYYWDLLEAGTAWFVNTFANLLGYQQIYLPQKTAREEYLDELAQVTKSSYLQGNIDGITDLLGKGFTLFKPRTNNEPDSMQHMLKTFSLEL